MAAPTVLTHPQQSPFLKLGILALVALPFAGTLLALRLLWQQGVTGRDLLLLLGLYVPISLGITIGFHRFLTHRGFTTNRAVKALLLILGSLAVEGPPLDWAANHRKHHAFADQPDDPHSPAEGLLHAHLGWLFTGQQADHQVYARDLTDDHLVVAISRTFPLWVAVTLLLPAILGGLFASHFLTGAWHGLLWGGAVRVFLTHHVTWSVNSVCHSFGNRPFTTRDRSRNQWLIGLLALGEGWHNNHHAFPRSALHGLRWWQLDVSGWTIRLLARTGVARDVQRVSAAAIRARATRALAA